MSKFLVPLVLTELSTRPARAEAGTVRFYLRGGQLRLMRPNNQEVDLVLDRTLDGLQLPLTTAPIQATDTVLEALGKLQQQVSVVGTPTPVTPLTFLHGGVAGFKGPLTRNPFI